MQMTDTFQEIRQIEREAESILASAEKKKEDILKDARREMVDYSMTESAKLATYREEAVAKARQKAEAAKQKILSASKKKIAALKQRASGNTENAVQTVLERFEGLFE